MRKENQVFADDVKTYHHNDEYFWIKHVDGKEVALFFFDDAGANMLIDRALLFLNRKLAAQPPADDWRNFSKDLKPHHERHSPCPPLPPVADPPAPVAVETVAEWPKYFADGNYVWVFVNRDKGWIGHEDGRDWVGSNRDPLISHRDWHPITTAEFAALKLPDPPIE